MVGVSQYGISDDGGASCIHSYLGMANKLSLSLKAPRLSVVDEDEDRKYAMVALPLLAWALFL